MRKLFVFNALLLIIGTVSFSQRSSNLNKGSNKSTPILLTKSSTQTVYKSVENEQVFNDITYYSYDTENRLISSITKSVNEINNLTKDSTLISYNEQGKIDFIERYITDSGVKIVKTLEYKNEGIFVHCIKSSVYLKGGPINICGPSPSLEDDIIIKVNDENSFFQVYNKSNDLLKTIEFSSKKQSPKPSCLNPYSLIGNSLFWLIVMDWPEKGNLNNTAKENEVMECETSVKHKHSSEKEYPDKIISTFAKAALTVTTNFKYKTN